jgi:hypothetical protein
VKNKTELKLNFFNQEALNGVQKNIIEGTIKFILDDIITLKPIQARKTLQEIRYLTLNLDGIEKDVWGSTRQLVDIIVHPYTQNRAQGDGNAYWHKALNGRPPISQEEISSCQTGVSNGIVYFYQSGFGSKILTEPQGLLGLTSRNDSSAPEVTKESTLRYILKLIDNSISDLEKNPDSYSAYELRTPKKLFMRAQRSDLDHLDAEYLIGQSFDGGMRGFPQNSVQAKKHYLRVITQYWHLGALASLHMIKREEKHLQKLDILKLGDILEKNKASYPEQLDAFLKELEQIENNFGKISEFEQQVLNLTEMEPQLTVTPTL